MVDAPKPPSTEEMIGVAKDKVKQAAIQAAAFEADLAANPEKAAAFSAHNAAVEAAIAARSAVPETPANVRNTKTNPFTAEEIKALVPDAKMQEIEATLAKTGETAKKIAGDVLKGDAANLKMGQDSFTGLVAMAYGAHKENLPQATIERELSAQMRNEVKEAARGVFAEVRGKAKAADIAAGATEATATATQASADAAHRAKVEQEQFDRELKEILARTKQQEEFVAKMEKATKAFGAEGIQAMGTKAKEIVEHPEFKAAIAKRAEHAGHLRTQAGFKPGETVPQDLKDKIVSTGTEAGNLETAQAAKVKTALDGFKTQFKGKASDAEIEAFFHHQVHTAVDNTRNDPAHAEIHSNWTAIKSAGADTSKLGKLGEAMGTDRMEGHGIPTGQQQELKEVKNEVASSTSKWLGSRGAKMGGGAAMLVAGAADLASSGPKDPQTGQSQGKTAFQVVRDISAVVIGGGLAYSAVKGGSFRQGWKEAAAANEPKFVDKIKKSFESGMKTGAYKGV